MRQFPAFFNMDDARVVVFGGGEEARRKVRLLAKTPAHITVIIGKDIDSGFAQEFAGRITIAPQAEAGAALDVARFAIVACRIDDNTERAITWARQYGVPLNVVDRPDLCDFTVPSIMDRGEIVAAVASGGSAPVLAKSVRAKLEALIPARIGDLAALAGRMRDDVKAKLPDASDRRQFWEQVLNGKAAELAYAGEIEAAEQAMRDALAGRRTQGVVHLVGAGPGDPELLTLKALRPQLDELGHVVVNASDGILKLGVGNVRKILRRDAGTLRDLINDTAGQLAACLAQALGQNALHKICADAAGD